MQKPMLMASYRAAYLIVKSKKAHNIGENLIKPCLAEMADIAELHPAAQFPNWCPDPEPSTTRPSIDPTLTYLH